jgi:hypothetical protein
MKKKYCGDCGKKLIKVEQPGFDEETGRRNHSIECPSDKCGHTGVEHMWVQIELRGNWIFGYTSTFRCSKCSEELKLVSGVDCV